MCVRISRRSLLTKESTRNYRREPTEPPPGAQVLPQTAGWKHTPKRASPHPGHRDRSRAPVRPRSALIAINHLLGAAAVTVRFPEPLTVPRLVDALFASLSYSVTNRPLVWSLRSLDRIRVYGLGDAGSRWHGLVSSRLVPSPPAPLALIPSPTSSNHPLIRPKPSSIS